ncbi:TPA: hypothetical protein SMT93_003755 [Proteus mirabilis]|nr:hypothetical protein [Proteus mirabilis]
MKQRFNHSAVHKNNARVREYRLVTQEGVKCLRAMLEDAKIRTEHRQQVLGGESDER